MGCAGALQDDVGPTSDHKYYENVPSMMKRGTYRPINSTINSINNYVVSYNIRNFLKMLR